MNKLSLMTLAVAALSSAAFAASTDVGMESVKFHGSYQHDYATGTSSPVGTRGAQENSTIVFNNLTSTPVTGFSRLETENPVFGAALTLAQGGRLQEIGFSIFNATTSGNTGTITGGQMTLTIYDNTTPYSGTGAITNPVLGTVSAALSYTGVDELPVGFFLTDSIVGLNALNIVVPTNVLVTQSFAPTGASGRNGYVSFAPDLVGSSGTTVYLSSTALAAGYYNLGTSPNFVDATPGFALVVPEPTSLAALSLGGLVLRRRRA